MTVDVRVIIDNLVEFQTLLAGHILCTVDKGLGEIHIYRQSETHLLLADMIIHIKYWDNLAEFRLE